MSNGSLPSGKRNWWEHRAWTVVFAVSGVIAAGFMLLMANQMYTDIEK